ncbi:MULTISPECIES: DsbE family thiol:disulfide interchange protein [Psychrobacter]|jgi:cytochrome c biogenesis protein CcmG/thiol:disulfide interchange protein DsbE|uniref:DsbE family thiol:disulfide interchange protein n=1 Tax=Psychrobacter TaxID=497 RepID=UPI000946DD5F|nr:MULTISPECIES: DsbE family thiol:disulfide interchange protein [Psychrobacter]MDE0492105.1 DsbE family thiol:disulfide interchange protein [Psychrobacter sp. A3]MDN5732928.1 DsbE family thiol:disulfide interchange protein [Psychrobacter sp.]OLF41976.1 thiol:disulfide interchange protein [Psychrobacter sp. Rd 27.2]HCH26044.1 DsbE family thiol:disulfide interchange protein [Psychrobacter sp.]
MSSSNHSSENSTQKTSVQGSKTMNKKQLKVWFLIPLIVFIGLLVMLYMRLGKPTDIVTNTALERPVPPFELPLLSDTSRIMTNDNLPDQPFLLNVWGSWCPTCIIEHPFLMQLEERGVNLVGVNYKDDIGDALSYLNRGGDPFSMSIQDLSGQFALDLGLTGAPETFVVDGKGVIRQHIIGEVNESNWQSRITPCLMVLNDANDKNISPDPAQVAEACK